MILILQDGTNKSLGGDFLSQILDIVNKIFYFCRMDTSNLISQAQFARNIKSSPQWITQLIKDKRLSVVMVGDIPYVNKDSKIKPASKKIPA